MVSKVQAVKIEALCGHLPHSKSSDMASRGGGDGCFSLRVRRVFGGDDYRCRAREAPVFGCWASVSEVH